MNNEERAVPGELVELLAKRPELRSPEDVFEISNGLYLASFIRQLDVATRSDISCIRFFIASIDPELAYRNNSAVRYPCSLRVLSS